MGVSAAASARRAHAQGHDRRCLLLHVRDVDRRRNGLAHVAVRRVLDVAHDLAFDERTAGLRLADACAYWIAAAKQSAREGFVDDSDRRRVGGVGAHEVAAGQQRRAVRAEPAGADPVEGGDVVFLWQRRTIRHLDARAGGAAADRRYGRQRGALHARHCGGGVERTPEQLEACSRLQTRGQRIDSGDEHRVAVEAEIARRERGERPHEQAGGDDEHQRERDLADNEQAAQAEAVLASIASSSRFERVVRLDARAAQGRGHPEQHRGGDRHGRREAEDPPVDRQREEDVVDGGRELTHQQVAAPLRERETEDRTCRREEEAFGEELARDSQP
jgi:hypothetical protein